MATDKQIEANRLNAQKCTGPRTPEGKATSSMNAFKTGLCAESEIIPGESREDYEELAADFYRDYAPANAAERSLVDTMIKSEWLNRRFMYVQSSIWKNAFRITPAQPVGFIFNVAGESIARAERCNTVAQRNFDKALTRLIDLQKKRGVKSPGIDSAPPELIADPQPAADTQPESPTEASKPLSPKLVSFRNIYQLNPQADSDAEEDPPQAA